MRIFKNLFIMLSAALIGCSGGPSSGDASGDMSTNTNVDMAGPIADMAKVYPMGMIQVMVSPSMPGLKIELIVDSKMMGEVLTGMPSTPVAIIAGMHDVQLIAPGYGYAVAGYQWDTQGEPVTQWKMRDVAITTSTTVQIKATLCRDLAGKWVDDNGKFFDSYMISKDGACTAGFPPFPFYVNGDKLTVAGDAGACSGVDAQLLNSGNRITVDCGQGEIYGFTRQ